MVEGWSECCTGLSLREPGAQCQVAKYMKDFNITGSFPDMFLLARTICILAKIILTMAGTAVAVEGEVGLVPDQHIQLERFKEKLKLTSLESQGQHFQYCLCATSASDQRFLVHLGSCHVGGGHCLGVMDGEVVGGKDNGQVVGGHLVVIGAVGHHCKMVEKE